MTLRTRLVWLLALIVVAQAAFIATLLMRQTSGPPETRDMTPPFAVLMELESLAPSDRQTMRRALVQRLPEMRAAVEETRTAAEAFSSVFDAEQFDEQAAEAAARALGEARHQQWETSSGIVIDVIGALPDDARQELMRRRAELREEGKGLQRGPSALGENGLPEE